MSASLSLNEKEGATVSQYVSKYAVCPYYHRHDDNRICCEGTGKGNTINLVFGDVKKLKDYGTAYCNSIEGCKKCLIHCALNTKHGVLNEI